MLPIFIPSRSRAARCLTIEQLGSAVTDPQLKRWVALVVPHEQRKEYEALARMYKGTTPFHVMSEPGVKGIAATRKLIGRMAETMSYDKFIMFDDDLRFAHRLSETDWHLTPNSSAENMRMLYTVEKTLDSYAHAGISARQANNQMDLPGEECVRCIRALAYRTKEFNLCTHGRVDIMEDFDITLQLIAKGYPNFVLTTWAQDQAQTQAKGGCSDYRSHALHARSVRRMATLWGDTVVRLREKANKTGGEFGKRLEATIYWKKALGIYERELV